METLRKKRFVVKQMIPFSCRKTNDSVFQETSRIVNSGNDGEWSGDCDKVEERQTRGRGGLGSGKLENVSSRRSGTPTQSGEVTSPPSLRRTC